MESAGTNSTHGERLLRPAADAAALGFISWLSVKTVLLASDQASLTAIMNISFCSPSAGAWHGGAAIWLGCRPRSVPFIAGISIASSPIAQYIAISLKPLRDFFLVVFFFSVGSGLDMPLLPAIALPAVRWRPSCWC